MKQGRLSLICMFDLWVRFSGLKPLNSVPLIVIIIDKIYCEISSAHMIDESYAFGIRLELREVNIHICVL